MLALMQRTLPHFWRVGPRAGQWVRTDEAGAAAGSSHKTTMKLKCLGRVMRPQPDWLVLG
jgi:hypothetical protein